MKKPMSLKFDFAKICANFLKDLPQRTTDVISRRFGLNGEGETLEAIGKRYGITRERVRQIEREGISKIKNKIEDYPKVFAYFNDAINSLGGVKKEDSLIRLIGNSNNYNQIAFLLSLSSQIEKYPESDEYHAFFASNKDVADSAKKAVELTIAKFSEEKNPISAKDFYFKQKNDIANLASKKIDAEMLDSYLEISKKIKKNPEGKIGLANWVEISPKGIKDIAYLVLKKEGKSLHFSKVAEMIQDSPYFTREKTHVATVHNELIKDQRFVLIGRGLYALKEWGYEPGVVRDIIAKILKDADRPMSREEILDFVSKQRIIKANTVFLNLQNKNYFLRDSDGNYTINTA
jgi:hypothetical protein